MVAKIKTGEGFDPELRVTQETFRACQRCAQDNKDLWCVLFHLPWWREGYLSWCQLPTRSPVHQVSHEGWAPSKGDNVTRNTPLCTEPLSFHKGEFDWALQHCLDGHGDLDEYQALEQQNMLWSFVIKSHLLLKLRKLIEKKKTLVQTLA